MIDFEFEALSEAVMPYRRHIDYMAKWKQSHRHLIAYYKEDREFAIERKELLTNEQAVYFFERLKARYKFRHILRIFKMRRHSGNCGSYEIKLSPPTNILTLAHEVAHAVHNRRSRAKREKAHNKRFYGIMRRIIKVINTNKATWNEAILASTRRKAESRQSQEQKAIAKQAEKNSPAFKLEQIRAKLKVWHTKEKRAKTAIKKLQRRQKIWEKKVIS